MSRDVTVGGTLEFVLSPGGGVFFSDVLDGQVTCDSSWTPYAQARLTCPLDDAIADAIDPTDAAYVPRAHLRLTRNPLDDPPAYQQNLFQLAVRSVTRDYEEHTMQVVATTDERFADTWVWPLLNPWVPGTSDLTAIVDSALTQATIGALDPDDPPVQYTVPEATEWRTGMSVMDYLKPLVDLAGRKLIADEELNWHLIKGGDPVTPEPRAFRMNLLPNPRYIGPDGTSGLGLSQQDQASGAPDGGPRTLFTANANQTGNVYIGTDDPASAVYGIFGGETYTGSAYIQTNVPGVNVELRMQFLDPSDTVIGTVIGAEVPTVTGDGGIRVQATGAAPIGANRSRVFVRLNGTGAMLTTGDRVAAAQRMLERAPAAGTYFDGTYADTATHEYYWTGPEHDSVSVEAEILPELTYGYDELVSLEARTSVDDGEYADETLVIYEWTTAAGSTTRRKDQSTSSGAFQPTWQVVRPDGVYPGPGAADVIQQRTNAWRYERSFRMLWDLRVRPGIVVNLDDGSTVTGGKVHRVTFNLDGTQDVTQSYT